MGSDLLVQALLWQSRKEWGLPLPTNTSTLTSSNNQRVTCIMFIHIAHYTIWGCKKVQGCSYRHFTYHWQTCICKCQLEVSYAHMMLCMVAELLQRWATSCMERPESSCHCKFRVMASSAHKPSIIHYRRLPCVLHSLIHSLINL